MDVDILDYCVAIQFIGNYDFVCEILSPVFSLLKSRITLHGCALTAKPIQIVEILILDLALSGFEPSISHKVQTVLLSGCTQQTATTLSLQNPAFVKKKPSARYPLYWMEIVWPLGL